MSAAPDRTVIRGGRVLVDGEGILTCDVGLRGGVIEAIGTDLPDADLVLDAAGLLVAPGVVDPHVHFGNTMPFLDEVAQDTGAALAGGITTIGCFLRSDTPYSPNLPDLIAGVTARSYVDMFFHLQIFSDDQIADIEHCVRDHGVTSFKFYLSGIPGIVRDVDEATLLRGMRTVAGLGRGGVVAVHCENKALINANRTALEQNANPVQDEPALVTWERAHPGLAEALAIESAAAVAEAAGARLYVVHLSSREGLDHVRRLRLSGADIVVETTSAYLGLQNDDPNGLLLKMVPPIRDGQTRRALWDGVRDGVIETIGTDNTARSRASKNPLGGVIDARPGYPMLATHVPAVLHHGYHQRGIPVEVLWRAMSRRPAEVFSLYPRKGAIRLGADADLILVDLDQERRVDPADLGSFSDFSPFEGKVLRGWPRTVIKAGQVVARDGRLVAGPNGQYLPRAMDGNDVDG